MEKLLISILIVIIGIVLLILSFYLYKKSRDSKRWNNIKGIILQSNLDKLVMEIDSPVTYRAKIEYSYTVDNKTYYSKRIFYGDFLRHSSFWNCRKLVDKYKKGDITDVYYNPLNPDDVVLQQGIHFNVFIVFITSLSLIFIGFIYHFYI